MKSSFFLTCLGALVFLLFSDVYAQITIPPEEAQKMGQLIWQNECKGSVEGLTSWNQGEEFASLGIGHFIWYPKGEKGPFVELFPSLIRYISEQGSPPPKWVMEAEACPWNTRADFLREIKSQKMNELRLFLKETTSLQALFMAKRLEQALPRILASRSEQQRPGLSEQFYRVANAPLGTYALVDYVNFKGEGIAPQERYNGYGWGLLQVLEYMQSLPASETPLQAFATSAKAVLARRIEHSPPERNEQRWLKGWYNRIETYTKGQ